MFTTIYPLNPWDQLQQPIHSANLPASYLLLLAALDKGWQVTGPVVLNRSPREGEACQFAFTLLKNAHQTYVQHLIIPCCKEVETFIRQEGLEVVAECCIL